MQNQLTILPTGSLALQPDLQAQSPASEVKKFHQLLIKSGEPPALFSLGAHKHAALPPVYDFWRNFTGRWLRERCLSDGSTKGGEQLPPLSDSQAQSIIDAAPPMPGAEYLSVSALQEKWRGVDEWLLQQAANGNQSIADYLEKHAPEWHVAGQLFFHLAENKNDEELPFAFIATWQPQEAASRGKHLPLARALELYTGQQQKALLRELLEPVQMAAQSSPLMADLIKNRAIYQPQAWSAHQAWSFLKEVPLLQNCGVIVRLPDWWAKRSRPQVRATLSTASSTSLGAEQLLKFQVDTVLDGKKLTASEWQQLMQAESGLISLKGKWVEVDREKLNEAMQQMETLSSIGDEEGLTFAAGMRLLAGASHDLSADSDLLEADEWHTIHTAPALSKKLSYMRDPSQLATALPVNSLKANLRHYQQSGARWLWHLNQLGLGACLADDMGLGKTIQVIALLLMIKKKRGGQPSLLVVPTSLLGNWKSELDKFAPGIKYQFVHNAMTDKKTIREWATNGLPPSTDVVLTSYGTLPRQSFLHAQLWHTVILDEAQAIKNAGTRQAKSVKQLQSQARVALTGTPVENRLSDLWSLFDFINPGLLGNFKRFNSFAKALEKRTVEKYAPLRKLVQPYILRRLKTDKDVISDLPDKTEVTTWCGLSKVQAAHYQKAVDDLRESLEGSDGIKRRGNVLAYMTRFKQICNHPSQLKGDGEYLPEHSGKLQRLGVLCDEISARQEKVLVFSQFREMCKPLTDFLADRFQRKGLTLHGGTSAKRRQQMVQEFQAAGGPPFFVISLKAGGTGLNLTAASHVIHFDRWWNPAVENQATDRAYRIGQKRNVLVHKFVCRGTIEEKVDEMIAAKSSLANELLEGSAESSLTELSDDELIRLVSLDIEKAQIEADG